MPEPHHNLMQFRRDCDELLGKARVLYDKAVEEGRDGTPRDFTDVEQREYDGYREDIRKVRTKIRREEDFLGGDFAEERSGPGGSPDGRVVEPSDPAETRSQNRVCGQSSA